MPIKTTNSLEALKELHEAVRKFKAAKKLRDDFEPEWCAALKAYNIASGVRSTLYKELDDAQQAMEAAEKNLKSVVLASEAP